MIQDRPRLARTPAHELALDCIEAGIEAADPRTAVSAAIEVDEAGLTIDGVRYERDRFDEVVVVGAGKASGRMAVALEALLGDWLAGGVVVVPDPVETQRIDAVVGGHPLPDQGSVAGARRVRELAESATERTLVLAAVTGGGSALLAEPAEGIGLDDLREATESLLAAGADIDEINAVRKHSSAVKGGGLVRAAAPATVVGLLVSDVVGDDPAVIASGPTAPDASTYADARAVLDRYGVDTPNPIRRRIEAGDRGDAPETPGPGAPAFDRVRNVVVANAWTALSAAESVATGRGLEPRVLSSRIRGEASEAGSVHAAIAEEVVATGNPVDPPSVLLSGGETTVSVEGSGAGGPNLEFALGAVLALPEGAVLACVDTDGEDGSTDAAGAIVDAGTVTDRSAARHALDRNDAHGYLDDRDALVVTGPTGTNVNDLRVLVVPGSEGSRR